MSRPDLDLSEILPLYEEFLGGYSSTASINFVTPKVPEGEEYVEPSLGWGRTDPTRQAGFTPRQEVDDAYQFGNGPAECSTSQVLVSTRPVFAWDVNGYYRYLGIPFPYVNASQGTLSKAYVAMGGQSDDRATYYLKQLLNRAVKAEYDAMPLGEIYLNDEYVQQEMKARAAAEAGRRTASGSYTEAEDVLGEWGYDLNDGAEPGVDTGDNIGKDVDTPERERYEPIEWVYSYWIWRCSPLANTTPLEQWQTLLISALSVAGRKVGLSVGLMGKQPQDYAVARFDGRWIVFLNAATEPTPELAEKAAAALLDSITRITGSTSTEPTEIQKGHA